MAAPATVFAELKRACDGRVAPASETDAVLGRHPAWVARPASTDEVSALMRVASARALAVVVRGAGTRLDRGAAPTRLDLVLDTSGLDELVEHAASDLVVVTGAGRMLAELHDDLGKAGQRLGIDPPRPGTVGGAVAAAASGPLRLRHGAVRDLVIGMTLVRADGVVAHSGGKVVKNVAGYDLAKLLTGSFGTLGVITQVALRLHPVPAGRYWVTLPVASAHEAASAVAALVHSQLMPAAIELDWRPAIDVTGGAEGTGEMSALLEGHVDGAQACAAEAAALLGGGATITDTAPSWWGLWPDAGATAQCKVTHEISRLRVLLDAAAATQTESGVRVALRGSPGVGVAQVALRGEVDQVVCAVEGLRSRSDLFGGTVVVLEAPAGLRQRVDVWGPVAGLDLMRAVKAQFDPGGLLAPGRFVGGI